MAPDEALKENRRKLSEAIRQDDAATARELAGGNVDLNRASRGMSFLGMAGMLGRAEIAGILLDAGADPDGPIMDGSTPLLSAASRGNTETARVLLEHGARLEAADGFGMTALTHAAIGHHHETVRALLEAGADPNASGQTGLSALSFAVVAGDETMVRLLMEHGAVPKGSNGVSAYVLAQQHPEMEAVLRHADGTELHDAARKGDLARAASLLDGGATVDQPDERGDTALIAAAGAGRPDIVQLLLEHGANPNAPGQHGRTALMQAALRGHAAVVDPLARAGADLEARDEWEETALLLALVQDHAEAAAALREAGAEVGAVEAALLGESERALEILGDDVDARGPGGLTVLMAAALRGDRDLVGALLDRGAGIDLLSTRGQSAMAWAAGRNRPDVARTLLERGADVNAGGVESLNPLHGAVMTRNVPMVALLLEHGADPNRLGVVGARPLHSLAHPIGANPEARQRLAAYGIEPAPDAESRILQMLLDAGADLEATDSHLAHTPLAKAALLDHVEAASMFLQAGANPNAVSSKGQTPLAHAVGHSSEMARLLLAHGARPSASMRAEAAWRGDARMVWLLMRHAGVRGALRGLPALFWAAMGGQKAIMPIVRGMMGRRARTLPPGK